MFFIDVIEDAAATVLAKPVALSIKRMAGLVLVSQVGVVLEKMFQKSLKC